MKKLKKLAINFFSKMIISECLEQGVKINPDEIKEKAKYIYKYHYSNIEDNIYNIIEELV